MIIGGGVVFLIGEEVLPPLLSRPRKVQQRRRGHSSALLLRCLLATISGNRNLGGGWGDIDVFSDTAVVLYDGGRELTASEPPCANHSVNRRRVSCTRTQQEGQRSRAERIRTKQVQR